LETKEQLKILFDHQKLEIKGKTTKENIKKLKTLIDHQKKKIKGKTK
jgi:hypothetical protein